jgi:GT2 family glycosyltransferase
VIKEPGRPLVTVIIVNYNGQEVLPECLEAVIRQDYPAFEVLVVDNASSDGSATLVEERFPAVRLMRSPVNRGFAGGNNLGFSAARGDYVSLLNSDAVPERDWLSRLVGGLERRGLVIASSQVITDGVPADEYEMNGTINYLGYNLPREFSDLETVFYCSAAALLIRREAVDVLFPEEFFLYQEDLHLSWKIRLRGGALGMVPDARVSHRGSYSTQRLDHPRVAYFQERNRLLNCLVFYQAWTLLRLLPYCILDAAAKLLMGVLGRGKPPGAVLRAYGAVLTRLRWIVAQRNDLQKSRTVGDREILALMTFRVVRGGNALGDMLNALSRTYARMVGLAFHA